MEDPESRLFLQEKSKERDRGRIKEINIRLEQIENEFEANLADDSSRIWLSKAELDSIPEDVIDDLEQGSGLDEGKLFLKFSTRGCVLAYAIDLNTRKKVYITAENRVRDLPNNLRFIVS